MHLSRCIEHLNRLVGFDTTSANSNLNLMNYVSNYLSEYGISSELIYDSVKSKANLYATIGPREKSGIMLSGHTDTVPVTGQNWATPPYQLTKDADRYYGRGTADMKSFIAVVLARVPDFKAAKLHTPIHLAFSYDEEIGCVGVRGLIEKLHEAPYRPFACIVGEPTSMKVARSHKGKIAVRVVVRGKACHSGVAPKGVNAINYAARLITWLESMALTKAIEGPYDVDHEIPHTTLHTGVINGGNALNIVPDHCEFAFEIRNISREDPQHLLKAFSDFAQSISDEMQENNADCGVKVEVTAEYPGLSTGTDEDVVSFVEKLADCTENAKIGFGTEGGLFSEILQIPTVVCGPGSMEQGHKPNEYVEVSQLEQCDQFMARLLNALSE